MKQLLSVEIMPPDEMRYDTAGDYWIDANGTMHVQVADTGNVYFNRIVAVHELVEVILTQGWCIGIGAIDRFDLNFHGEGEPGDDPNCPYRHAHCLATAVERMLVAALHIDWSEYDAAVSTGAKKAGCPVKQPAS